MGYIVLSKKQVEGQLNVKLCKDKASADSYRKQLIKQYHDVVILSKGDHKLITSKLFKAWVNGEDNDGGDDNNPDPIWNGESEDLLVNSSDTNSDKHNEIYKHDYGGDELYPELTLEQAKDLVGDLSGGGGDEEAHKAWDKEGEGKVLENTFINAFGDENEDLTPQCFHADEDGDEYYLSSNGNRYYLFKKMVTLKGDLARTWYMFGKKEWSRTNDLTLLRFYNIPYDKCVVENKSGYPFLKTEVTLNEEIKQKTPTWDL